MTSQTIVRMIVRFVTGVLAAITGGAAVYFGVQGEIMMCLVCLALAGIFGTFLVHDFRKRT